MYYDYFATTDIHTAAELPQSCLTLWDPIDGSPPGSPVPGILQARTLEWVAISFSNAWKWKVKGKSFSRVWLFVTPWTTAYQAPLSMGFSRQWSGVPSPSPRRFMKTSNLGNLWRYTILRIISSIKTMFCRNMSLLRPNILGRSGR